jgi:fatty-acyl-CoA synthase
MRFVGDLARLNARRFPHKRALSCAGRHMTFAEMNALANRVAHAFVAEGIRAGESVALLANNCLEYLPLYLGIAKAGAVAVPLNFRCTPEELAFMLRDSGSSVLLHGPEFAPLAATLAQQLNALRRLVLVTDPSVTSQAGALGGFIAEGRDEEPAIRFDETAPAAILYTSGTTGRPKGAVLSHRAVIETTACIAQGTRVRHDDVALVTVPLFHGGGLMVLTQPHIYVGASAVVMPRFDPAETLQVIAEGNITTFFGVPSQYRVLLNLPGAAEYGRGTLRNAWYGAAPMPLEVLQRALARWPGVGFYQLYGQTETTLVAVLTPEEHTTHLGVTGRELAGSEMRLVDETGADVAEGAVGEVVVRREYGMTGYHSNPEATVQTIRDGWIHTGDLATREHGGYITLVDRMRDVLISGGENIYPRQIEDVYFGHPDILECAVVGQADVQWGEVPVGFAVLRPGAKIDSTALITWGSERLARYKVPRRWHFVAELPKTANGKVRKTVLREQLTSAGA